MDCDVLVIGSGPGGYRAAVLAALRGQKTVIVERQTWGGCCLNRGCVPKKAWHHSAQLLDAAAGFSDRGLLGGVRGDLAQAWRHQHQVVNTVRDSYQQYLKRLGVVALEGEATFEGPGAVLVKPSDTLIHAASIILATGSEPSVPSDLPVVPGRILQSDLLFDEPVPEGSRVIVIGAGIVGMEFAYILRKFERDVLWFTRSDPFARKDFSPVAMGLMRQRMTDLGVAPVRGAVKSLSADAQGVRLESEEGGIWTGDWALLATGRRPVTAGLGLTRVGIVVDGAGFIPVDATMQTPVPGIYAIGDCVAGPMTANRALYEAGLVVDNILAPTPRLRDLLRVPEAIYGAVELARIGLSEEQAEDAGLEPAVGFAAFEVSPQALGQGKPEGYVRLIADLDSGALLGGEVVGAQAGELIHMLSGAPAEGALRHIAATAFNHPARTEEFQNAVETLAAKWKLESHVFGVKPAADGGD